MSANDKYYTFPLAVLQKENRYVTPLEVLELAADCGALNAGKGYRNRNGDDEFEEAFEKACEHFELQKKEPDPFTYEGYYLLGAKICGMSLPQDYNLKAATNKALDINPSGVDFFSGKAKKQVFLRMSSSSLWAAIEQARYDADPTLEKPTRGLSWREFRVLAAILSWPETKEGFTSPGWESIQFRANGFVTKEEFRKRKKFPDHLPKLSRKQIRDTLDTLEALNMFARFRLSTGPRGGRMFYSFRHTRDELAEAVCKKVNFQDRARVLGNREDDHRKCMELLKRAKSGTSPRQVDSKGGAKEGAKGESK